MLWIPIRIATIPPPPPSVPELDPIIEGLYTETVVSTTNQNTLSGLYTLSSVANEVLYQNVISGLYTESYVINSGILQNIISGIYTYTEVSVV